MTKVLSEEEIKDIDANSRIAKAYYTGRGERVLIGEVVEAWTVILDSHEALRKRVEELEHDLSEYEAEEAMRFNKEELGE